MALKIKLESRKWQLLPAPGAPGLSSNENLRLTPEGCCKVIVSEVSRPGHVSLEYVFSGTYNGFEYWQNAEDPLHVIYKSGDWLLKPSGFGAGVVWGWFSPDDTRCPPLGVEDYDNTGTYLHCKD